MFKIFQCFAHTCIRYISKEEKEEIPIEAGPVGNLQDISQCMAFQKSIIHLKNAEDQAFQIVERAKSNRKEYLQRAESAAEEIVKPYYDLADQEFREIEASLNRELHIKTLENVLNLEENSDQSEDIELHHRKNNVMEYIFSKVSDVQLVLENPKYVKSRLEKHKIGKSRRKRSKIRSRLLSWTTKSFNEKEQEVGKVGRNKKKDQNTKEKAIRFYVEEKDSSMSTIELDEDYSRIDNMYCASRVVNSFNTIHLN
ncbi:hypothetical protein OJ253_3373 [Cryptosporidium canis]|uniref:Uncharacterized protein n=1 Tax=Cryptosporidium canis TaxID=195482 RepID=A0A9D5DGQ2_9CRYT|nr:hypothetical protein OJ253_3373 [Cryptosporidium canis]